MLSQLLAQPRLSDCSIYKKSTSWKLLAQKEANTLINKDTRNLRFFNVELSMGLSTKWMCDWNGSGEMGGMRRRRHRASKRKRYLGQILRRTCCLYRLRNVAGPHSQAHRCRPSCQQLIQGDYAGRRPNRRLVSITMVSLFKISDVALGSD